MNLNFQLCRRSDGNSVLDIDLGQASQVSVVKRSRRNNVKSTTALMFGVVCIFGVCSSPLLISEIVTKTDSEILLSATRTPQTIIDDRNHIFRFQLAIYGLRVLNCSLNVIIFNLFGKKFRSAMFKMFGSWWTGSHDQYIKLKLGTVEYLRRIYKTN